MFSKTSVTLTREVEWLPMALTTTTLCSAMSLQTSCAASLILSADATQVPPNLWTCQCPPLGHTSGFSKVGASTAIALTTGVLRHRLLETLQGKRYYGRAQMLIVVVIADFT